MLSRVLAVALCLSVTNRCSVKKDEQINLIFGLQTSFDQSCTVLRKFRYLQK